MQIRYVNIYFDPQDAYLSDIDLLRLMQDQITHADADITQWPVMREHRLCYSIAVTGDFHAVGDVYDAALNEVYVWIRYLASDGLPFYRRDVFLGCWDFVGGEVPCECI